MSKSKEVTSIPGGESSRFIENTNIIITPSGFKKQNTLIDLESKNQYDQMIMTFKNSHIPRSERQRKINKLIAHTKRSKSLLKRIFKDNF